MTKWKKTIITLMILIILNNAKAIIIENVTLNTTNGAQITINTNISVNNITINDTAAKIEGITLNDYHYDEDGNYVNTRNNITWYNTTHPINTTILQSQIRFFDTINEIYDSDYDFGNYTANGTILRFWYGNIQPNNYNWTYVSTDLRYQSRNYSFTHNYSTLTNKNYTIQHNQLQLRFWLNGIANNTVGEVWNNNQSYGFNATTVLLQQENLSVGKVKVTFNKTGTENYTQFYEYNNDLTVNVSEDIELLTKGDWSNHFQVLDYANSPLKDVTVRYEASFSTIGSWEYHDLYGQRLTEDDGITYFLTDTQSQAVFTFTKVGYEPIEVLLTIGDESFTRDDPLTIYMQENEWIISDSIWEYINPQFEDRTQDIIGRIVAKNRDTVELQTTYRNNLGQARINLTNNGDSLERYDFTLESGVDFNNTGNSNITLYIYIDDALFRTKTIQYLSARTQILDFPTIDEDILNPILFFAIIIISITVAKVLQNNGAGMTTFLTGSIIIGLISTKMIWLSIIAIIYAASRILTNMTRE